MVTECVHRKGNRGLYWTLAATLLSLLTPQPTLAQTPDDIRTELWLDYNPSWGLGRNTEFYGDIGVRSDLELSGYYRIVVRPSIRYSPSSSVRIAGGLGSFYTHNDIIANRWEIRPWQGVTVTWPRRRVSLEHFVRLEEMFDFNTTTWESLNSIRARYRLRAFTNFGATRPGRYWRVMGSVEVFATLAGEQGQSREWFRLTAGLERGFQPGLRMRFDSTWEKEGRIFGDGSTDNIFLRVRLFTKFGA